MRQIGSFELAIRIADFVRIATRRSCWDMLLLLY